MIDLKKVEEFNNEPVYYCEHCLSLCIKSIAGEDYCENCGSTDIATTHINKWKEMCVKRFGKELY